MSEIQKYLPELSNSTELAPIEAEKSTRLERNLGTVSLQSMIIDASEGYGNTPGQDTQEKWRETFVKHNESSPLIIQSGGLKGCIQDQLDAFQSRSVTVASDGTKAESSRFGYEGSFDRNPALTSVDFTRTTDNGNTIDSHITADITHERRKPRHIKIVKDKNGTVIKRIDEQ